MRCYLSRCVRSLISNLNLSGSPIWQPIGWFLLLSAFFFLHDVGNFPCSSLVSSEKQVSGPTLSLATLNCDSLVSCPHFLTLYCHVWSSSWILCLYLCHALFPPSFYFHFVSCCTFYFFLLTFWDFSLSTFLSFFFFFFNFSFHHFPSLSPPLFAFHFQHFHSTFSIADVLQSALAQSTNLLDKIA